MTAEPIQGEIVQFDRPTEAAILTPLAMIDRALASGASVEVLEKLMALQERYDANMARKAFDNAVAAAKGEIGPIVKDREVDFTSAKGRTSYRHESLAAIAKIVGPALDRQGLSYRYRATQDGGRVTVTCVLAHRDGYSEETTLAAGNDSSGNKNDIQAIGSATTYLQRYTLKLALGLATTDQDDDGAATDKPEHPISGAAQKAIDLIGECDSLEALTKWREVNDPVVQKLDRNDADAVVRAWKARAREIREGASQ